MDLHQRVMRLQRPDHDRTVRVTGSVVSRWVIIDTQHITFLYRSQQVRLLLQRQKAVLYYDKKINKRAVLSQGNRAMQRVFFYAQ